jgi:chromosome segregation ATPase
VELQQENSHIEQEKRALDEIIDRERKVEKLEREMKILEEANSEKESELVQKEEQQLEKENRLTKLSEEIARKIIEIEENERYVKQKLNALAEKSAETERIKAKERSLAIKESALKEQETNLKASVLELDHEKKNLRARSEVLENFHEELLKKEKLGKQRYETTEKAIAELKQKENELKRKVSNALSELEKVNIQVTLQEKKLQNSSGKIRDYELNSMSDEMAHLQKIEKDLSAEYADLGDMGFDVIKIEKLIHAGDLENAANAYERLRHRYSGLSIDARKRIYPRLIALHKKIVEKSTSS